MLGRIAQTIDLGVSSEKLKVQRLKTQKTRKGFVLNLSLNQKQLEMWKGRFGITDSDIRGGHVNDVNVIEDKTLI